MISFGGVCIRLLLLFAICKAASARLFYWPGQSFYTKYELFASEESNVEFHNCGASEDIFQLTSDIVLTPQVVTPGNEVTIEAEGQLSETIEDGAYAEVVVKIGRIKILSKKFDLCEELRNNENEIQCPIQKGKLIIKQTIKLPKEIPPAIFNVDARVYSTNDEDVACQIVRANFQKHRKGFTSFTRIDLSQY